ncbi:hypothetical protein AKJ16_DCAP11646 [Drosera capensis]
MKLMNSKRYKKMAKKNSNCRKKQRHMHTTGRTSFAVVRQKLQVVKKDKEPPTRVEIITRSHIWIPSQNLPKMTELQSQEVDESSNSGDPFGMVMPKENPDLVRLDGTGVTKTDLKSKLSVT